MPTKVPTKVRVKILEKNKITYNYMIERAYVFNIV